MYGGFVAPDSAARIPVERIAAPVLLISGGDDQLWPSKAMADQVAARMGAHGGSVEHLSYPRAGHTITLPNIDSPRPAVARLADMGGTATTNRAAAEDAWPKVVSFLRSTRADTRSP
jgi:dienelactone hydrolase